MVLLRNRVENIRFSMFHLLALFVARCPDVLNSAPTVIVLCAGKKTVTLEIYTEQNAGVRSVKRRCLGSSGLELKLDELRKELSYAGGIVPHSVLSMEQIRLLSSQKPNSLEQASFKYVWICSVEWIKMNGE